LVFNAIVLSCLSLPLGGIACANGSHIVSNVEYGFSVSFPNGKTVCTITTGGHQKGFFVLLEGNDCEGERFPGIGVNADYNSSFERSPEDSLRGLCGKNLITDGDFGTGPLSFAGRLSAACRVDNSDGSIIVYVDTMAGNLPDENVPTIEYIAALYTATDRLDGDLNTLRDVLGSVKIQVPEQFR